jgi:hypothetical protein
MKCLHLLVCFGLVLVSMSVSAASCLVENMHSVSVYERGYMSRNDACAAAKRRCTQKQTSKDSRDGGKSRRDAEAKSRAEVCAKQECWDRKSAYLCHVKDVSGGRQWYPAINTR